MTSEKYVNDPTGLPVLVLRTLKKMELDEATWASTANHMRWLLNLGEKVDAPGDATITRFFELLLTVTVDQAERKEARLLLHAFFEKCC